MKHRIQFANPAGFFGRCYAVGTVLNLVFAILLAPAAQAQQIEAQRMNSPVSDSTLDARVQTFLQSHEHQWRDLNVPAQDGEVLYNLIIKHGYTRALDIGTSTGHSAIWMAWALSKTGGKLITVEIDEDRHREAMQNFKEAGVEEYIDARLGNAHEIVPALQGPFDFVFSDADKGWYTNYLKAVMPKLTVGGCFTAHNVSSNMWGISQFMDYLESLPNMDTQVDNSSGEGLSISYKTAE